MQAIMSAEQRLPSTQFTFTSNLGASLDTMSRLPMPAAKIKAVNPYLLAWFTWVQGFLGDGDSGEALP